MIQLNSASFVRPVLGTLALGLLTAGCHRRSDPFGSGSTGIGPLAGQNGEHAAYVDIDRSGTVNAGDELWMRFNQPMSLGSTTGPVLDLPVAGDSTSNGPGILIDTDPQVVRLVMGSDGSLRSRGVFSGALADNEPSGLRVSPAMPGGALVSFETGLDALRGGNGIDVVPEFAEGEPRPDAKLVAAVDMDCDGFTDLVSVTAGKGNSLRVDLQGASGPFVLADLVAVNDVRAMTIFDADQDGRPDVVIGQGDDSVRIYRNLGSEPGSVSLVATGFVSTANFGTPQVLAHGDLNRDGDQDLLIGTDEDLFQAFGEDETLFGTPFGTGADGDSYRLLVPADFDRDAILDLYVATDTGDRILYFAENGLIELTLPRAGGEFITAADAGDVNRDGRLDLVLATEQAVLLWAQLPGGFDPTMQQTASLDAGTRDLVVADIDGDSAPDVVRLTGTDLDILGGDGLGSFTRSPRPRNLQDSRGLAVADLDQDGDLDAFTGGQGTRLWYGSATGSFGSSTLEDKGPALAGSDIFPGTGTTYDVIHADWDMDGDVDVATSGPGFVRLWRNQGAGAFELDRSLDVQNDRAQRLAFADFDMDGDLDLFAACIGTSSRLWLADAAGEYPDDFEAIAPGSQGTCIGIGDLDRDGDLDLVLGTVRTESDRILLNGGRVSVSEGFQGGGGPTFWAGFDDELVFFNDRQTNDIAVRDLDCDGDLDLAIAQGPGERNTLWRNSLETGALDLQLVQLPAFQDQQTRTVRVGDVNRDGFLDLIFANRSEIRTHFGTGNLAPDGYPSNTILNSGPVAFADLGDMNGDGLADLVVGTEMEEGLRVHLGNGISFEGAAAQLLPSNFVTAIDLGDHDGDGDLDLVSTEVVPAMPNATYANR